jgi:UDP-N-acetyl-alpha-D-muramoyl-L-alanyl-L-glutamate epimerase
VVKDNYNKFIQLRNEFKFFAFEGFTIQNNFSELKISFEFNSADKYFFYPTLTFRKKHLMTGDFSESEIENFVFHIGLIELISYWKATCSPVIIIKPNKLNQEQIHWWKNLWFNGLGEFFYVNNIHTQKENFVEIVCDSEKHPSSVNLLNDDRKVLIPIGGGKDSAVTMELLKNRYRCIPMILNPREASLKTVSIGGFDSESTLEIFRTIHPQLLQLNSMEFLNGHTPFSALLAFVSIFSAYLTGSKSIALSNESSANEPTDAVSGVNHQYSKSFEFEKDFRNYNAKYISPDINYYSFLRPLNELNIAKIFSRLTSYHQVFKSCNAGSKTDTWCGKCSKCLFTYIILSPFLESEKLTRIFNKNLFSDPDLKMILDELTGLSQIKPFECVGTVDEVNFALCKTIEQYKKPLPYLLNYYLSTPQYQIYRISEQDFSVLNKEHFLSEKLFSLLKTSVDG